jgi:hypothetical protein
MKTSAFGLRLLAPVLLALGAASAFAEEHVPVFIVNSDDDRDGSTCDVAYCNLRAAIHAANQARDGAEIHFDLPASFHHIRLQSALPPIGSRVLIDGATQHGTDCPMPVVHVDGSEIVAETPVNGLVVAGDRTLVRGLVISNFSGHGILVRGSENLLECLFVGVDPAGREPQGNAGHGIAVVGGFSNQVGGPMPELGNLLSANGGYGLYTENAINTILGHNAIGVDIFGNPTLPNGNEALGEIDSPPPPSVLDPHAVPAVTAAVEHRIARVAEELHNALDESGLFEKYVELLGWDSGVRAPENFDELVAALAAEPELYKQFILEVAAVGKAARMTAAEDLARIIRTSRHLLPTLGRSPQKLPEEQLDLLAESLLRFDPGDYVVSGSPSEIVSIPAEGIEPPGNLLFRLRWHSLEVIGPTTFSAKLGEFPLVQTCEGHTTPCTWPIIHDILPFSVKLLWESTELTQQEIEDIVQENGYLLYLSVNGRPLVKGPLGGPYSPGQSYVAASFPGEPCPTGSRCLATNVLLRHAMINPVQGDVQLPWTFELEVMKLEELDFPGVPIGVDQFGNVIFATHEAAPFAKATREVQPNSTSAESWFSAALFETFQHERCSNCHGFETFAGVEAHSPHTSAESMKAHLQPSLYVPGGHVIACEHCHYYVIPPTDPNGKPWHETEWLVPFHDLDVNWSKKNAAQICSRVVTNLPTTELRQLHFHGDARLFWAVNTPLHPFGGLLPNAPPGDWTEFLRRVDLWNVHGARCP